MMNPAEMTVLDAWYRFFTASDSPIDTEVDLVIYLKVRTAVEQ